jgi:hypothetical protein
VNFIGIFFCIIDILCCIMSHSYRTIAIFHGIQVIKLKQMGLMFLS